MPDHTTWFRFLPFYEDVMALIYSIPLPEAISAQSSWIDGVERYGGEHVFNAFFVLILLFGMAVVVRGKLTDVKAALVPDPKMSLRTFSELITEMYWATLRY